MIMIMITIIKIIVIITYNLEQKNAFQNEQINIIIDIYFCHYYVLFI